MERRAGGENVAKGEDEAENKSEAEERMRCKSGGPHFVGIDASDENLAIREFEESFEGRVCERNDETFGQELNGFAAAREGIGHRVVVADGTLPFFEHTALIEFRFANGSAATPAEVVGFFAEHGDDGRVPGGQQQRRKIGAVWNEPAHRGGGTVADIVKRPDHAAHPGFFRAPVRIDEDNRFDVLGQLRYRVNEVVDLFTAAIRPSGEKDGCFDARLRSDAFYGWSGGIGLRGEYEKNFVILMIEFAESNEVLLEAGLGTTAGTDDGR